MEKKNSNLEVLYKSLFGKSKERTRARYMFINRLAKRHGFRLHHRRFSPWKEERFSEVIKKGNYVFSDKKFMIYQLAGSVAALDGDTAECGVFQGYGSWLILHAGGKPDRPHLMFDSFEGLSEPAEIDNHEDKNRKQWKKHDMAYPLELVKEKFRDFSQVEYYKGWIPERFDEVSDRQFSFVHIDVDLYQPTLDSLRFFYPRMNKGGVILCDDYAATGTPGAYRAMNDFFADKPENPAHTVPGSGFIIKL